MSRGGTPASASSSISRCRSPPADASTSGTPARNSRSVLRGAADLASTGAKKIRRSRRRETSAGSGSSVSGIIPMNPLAPRSRSSRTSACDAIVPTTGVPAARADSISASGVEALTIFKCLAAEMSIGAGTTNFPPPLILSASAGIGIVDRAPAARNRPTAITTTESLSGGPPEPSSSTAPRIALEWLTSLGLHELSKSALRTSAAGRSMNLHHSRALRIRKVYNRPRMTPETPQNSEVPAPGMNEFSRIAGVFFEPAKTFEDIAERPRWFVPMLFILVSVWVMLGIFSQRIGWETVVRDSMDRNPRTAQMTAQERESAISIGSRFAAVAGFGGTAIVIPCSYLLIAAVLVGIAAGMMSAPVKFKQVFAVVCYSHIPMIVSSLLAIVVIFLKGSEFNLQNPLMFNPAAAMDPLTTSKFVYSIASSLDLFSFWVIFLIATGLAAGSRHKLSFGGALFAVILPWAIYVVGKSSLQAMFS